MLTIIVKPECAYCNALKVWLTVMQVPFETEERANSIYPTLLDEAGNEIFVGLPSAQDLLNYLQSSEN
jgi:glutaredoxin